LLPLAETREDPWIPRKKELFYSGENGGMTALTEKKDKGSSKNTDGRWNYEELEPQKGSHSFSVNF